MFLPLAHKTPQTPVLVFISWPEIAACRVSSRQQNTPEPAHSLLPPGAPLPRRHPSAISKCFQAEAVNLFVPLVSSDYPFLLGFYAIKFFFSFLSTFYVFLEVIMVQSLVHQYYKQKDL